MNANNLLNRNNRVTKLALAFAVLLAYSIASAETAPQAFGVVENANFVQNQEDSLVSEAPYQEGQYPEVETMLALYRSGKQTGLLWAGEYEETPTLAKLRQAYDYLQLRERLALKSTSNVLPITQKATTACRLATLNCIYESAKQLQSGFSSLEYARGWACAIAAAGRNQDSPLISSECSEDLAGAAACSAANDACGYVSTPVANLAAFIGASDLSDATTVTCGTIQGSKSSDRVLELGTHETKVNGVTKTVGFTLQCTSGSEVLVGRRVSRPGGGGVGFCNRLDTATQKYAMEGGRFYLLPSGGFIDAKLRCDNTTANESRGAGDLYVPASLFIAPSAAVKKDSVCAEGQYVWGIRAYVNKSFPLDQQYITGFNLMCR